MLQKLALRDREKSMTGVDNVNDIKGYCSVKWAVGIGLVILNSIVQSLVLPHLDLTLLSCNAATAIITNMILSTKVLGEQFIWQYDLTAMFFIALGTVTIVVQANTQPVTFSGEIIKSLLLTFRSMTYLIVCLVLFIADRMSLRRTLENLRKFEADAEAYDELQMQYAMGTAECKVPLAAMKAMQAQPNGTETSSSRSVCPILPRKEDGPLANMSMLGDVSNRSSLLGHDDENSQAGSQSVNPSRH